MWTGSSNCLHVGKINELVVAWFCRHSQLNKKLDWTDDTDAHEYIMVSKCNHNKVENKLRSCDLIAADQKKKEEKTVQYITISLLGSMDE